MRSFRLVLASCVALLAIGCGSNEQIIGGKENKNPIRTFVSLSPSTTELIAGKLYGQKLVGRTASCNFPTTPAVSQCEIVMNGVKPNFERIAEIHPDMVFYDGALTSEADVKKLEQLGLKTMGINDNNLEDFCLTLHRIGALMMLEGNANDYVTGIHSAMERGSAPIEPKPKLVVMLPGKGSEHYIVGVDSFQADVMRNCGAEVVGPKGSLFVPVNAEELISMNPDVIFTAGDPTPILNDPRFKGINAIKNKRTIGFLADVITRRGARIVELMDKVTPMLRNPNAR